MPYPKHYIVRALPEKTPVPLIAIDELPPVLRPTEVPMTLDAATIDKWSMARVGDVTAFTGTYNVPSTFKDFLKQQFDEMKAAILAEPNSAATFEQFEKSVTAAINKMASTSVVESKDDPTKTKDAMTPGVYGKKKYCTHWIRTGNCDYVQEGCKFEHVIPDAETRLAIGIRDYPRWAREELPIAKTEEAGMTPKDKWETMDRTSKKNGGSSQKGFKQQQVPPSISRPSSANNFSDNKVRNARAQSGVHSGRGTFNGSNRNSKRDHLNNAASKQTSSSPSRYQDNNVKEHSPPPAQKAAKLQHIKRALKVVDVDTKPSPAQENFASHTAEQVTKPAVASSPAPLIKDAKKVGDHQKMPSQTIHEQTSSSESHFPASETSPEMPEAEFPAEPKFATEETPSGKYRNVSTVRAAVKLPTSPSAYPAAIDPAIITSSSIPRPERPSLSSPYGHPQQQIRRAVTPVHDTYDNQAALMTSSSINKSSLGQSFNTNGEQMVRGSSGPPQSSQTYTSMPFTPGFGDQTYTLHKRMFVQPGEPKYVVTGSAGDAPLPIMSQHQAPVDIRSYTPNLPAYQQPYQTYGSTQDSAPYQTSVQTPFPHTPQGRRPAPFTLHQERQVSQLQAPPRSYPVSSRQTTGAYLSPTPSHRVPFQTYLEPSGTTQMASPGQIAAPQAMTPAPQLHRQMHRRDNQMFAGSPSPGPSVMSNGTESDLIKFDHGPLPRMSSLNGRY